MNKTVVLCQNIFLLKILQVDLLIWLEATPNGSPLLEKKAKKVTKRLESGPTSMDVI